MEPRPSVIDRLRQTHHLYFSGFAMIVDINSYETWVGNGQLVAQFTRDVLGGAVSAVEAEGGDVVGIMGDAFLAILPDAESAGMACFTIARDVDGTCDYIAREQASDPDAWNFAPGGPSLKISIEYGEMEDSTISSKFLGSQTILCGTPIVYADRISRAGVGNRCLLGPRAAALWPYPLEGPFQLAGKHEGSCYDYYRFDLGDIWREAWLPTDH